jgi:predicted glycosyltransferase
MFLGDSQTMTSEAAILGTPALKCNTFAGELSVPNELENNYGLCYSYKPENFNDFLDKIDELIEKPDLKEQWNQKKEDFLKDKIDVSAFIVWFIENYPQSAKQMKDNPDYQYNFN